MTLGYPALLELLGPFSEKMKCESRLSFFWWRSVCATSAVTDNYLGMDKINRASGQPVKRDRNLEKASYPQPNMYSLVRTWLTKSL